MVGLFLKAGNLFATILHVQYGDDLIAILLDQREISDPRLADSLLMLHRNPRNESGASINSGLASADDERGLSNANAVATESECGGSVT